MFPLRFPMAIEIAFTDIWLKKIKSEYKREDYRDKGTRGLQLRVSPSGVKTFSFVFRLGSKMGRATIGKYPEIELKSARQKADHYRKLVSQGTDPRAEKQASRSLQEMTVEKMATQFIEIYAKPKNSSWKQAEANLRLYLLPNVGRLSISDVKRAHIHEILDQLSLQGKLASANRSLAHIKKFFGWLVERGYLENSPADHIKRRHEEHERERVLTDDELKSIWTATGSMSEPYSAWIKLLFLCGQRRVETARIKRSQIIDQTWQLSREDTKNKQPLIIPLSLQAIQVVGSLLEGDGQYLIKSGRNGDKPINSFSKSKKRIDQFSDVLDWTYHDIRRTVATNLSKLGTDRFIIQKIINHSDGSVTAIYDRYSYLNEKREALQKWADKLDEIIK